MKRAFDAASLDLIRNNLIPVTTRDDHHVEFSNNGHPGFYFRSA